MMEKEKLSDGLFIIIFVILAFIRRSLTDLVDKQSEAYLITFPIIITTIAVIVIYNGILDMKRYKGTKKVIGAKYNIIIMTIAVIYFWMKEFGIF